MTVIKNLFYQICPLNLTNQWRFNIECMLPYLPQFNGRLILVIKTGDLMAPVSEVTAYFDHFSNVEYRFVPNDPKLGEAGSLLDGLQTLRSQNANELTFYAHTKGISPKYLPEDYDCINVWVRSLYKKNLESITVMESLVNDYSFFGSFKRYGYFGNLPVNWHFSGSFYWFRHDVMFSQLDTLDLPHDYYVSEMLPALIAPQESAYCFFDDGAQDVYQYTDHDWAMLEHPTQWFLLNRFLYRQIVLNKSRLQQLIRRI